MVHREWPLYFRAMKLKLSDAMIDHQLDHLTDLREMLIYSGYYEVATGELMFVEGYLNKYPM